MSSKYTSTSQPQNSTAKPNPSTNNQSHVTPTKSTSKNTRDIVCFKYHKKGHMQNQCRTKIIFLDELKDLEGKDIEEMHNDTQITQRTRPHYRQFNVSYEVYDCLQGRRKLERNIFSMYIFIKK